MKGPVASLPFPCIGMTYLGLVYSFLFLLCVNFRSGERGATDDPPQQRVVFPCQRRLCEEFYPLPDVASSRVSKSKLLCKVGCNFSTARLDVSKCRFCLYMLIRTHLFLYISIFVSLYISNLNLWHIMLSTKFWFKCVFINVFRRPSGPV